MKYLIGIDEAGRGPLAGPVAVGAALVRSGFDWSQVGGIRDSKKMTALARERFFMKMQRMRREGVLDYSVALAPAALIDELGIVAAVANAMKRSLARLDARPSECSVFLDGTLYAPEAYARQQTIVGGDDVLPVISLAAIAAKVTRDRFMERIAKRFPAYGFDVHKGYGTLAHRRAIAQVGLCEVHRTSFCSRILPGAKS